MTFRTAAKIKAIDQARQKMKELTKEGIVAFSFILTDDGPELMGEEDVASKLMEVFEEQKIIELAQRIKLRGQDLSHRNTRTIGTDLAIKMRTGFSWESQGKTWVS